MSERSQHRSSQQKWDQRFATGQQPPKIAELLRDNMGLLPRQGRGLDLACGLGANSLFLAAHGLHMEAWDISQVALDKLSEQARQQHLDVHTRWVDIESRCVIAPNQFDLIVVSHFLYRPICKTLSAALRPNGLLFYQTFCATPGINTQHGTAHCTNSSTPLNPLFKLKPGELLHLFANLEVVHYREGETGNDSHAHKAYFIGRRIA